MDENGTNPSDLKSTAIASVDWYEIGGQVTWDDQDSEYEFRKLDHVLRKAQDRKFPEPWTIAGKTVLVYPGGIGSGKQSRMSYRIEWGPLVIGLADRPSESRQLNNFYLKASGEACLLLGMRAILDFQYEIIRSFCGVLSDSWLKRIDLCVDLPGVSVKDHLVPAYLQDQFITSTEDWGAYAGPKGPKGFAFSSSRRIRVNAYDKLYEVKRKGPDYQQAMVQYRWRGSWPESATRVEYQIRKPWLDQYSIGGTAADTLVRLGDLVAKVTSEGPRPLLRFTSTRPDREHGHQGRAKTLPLWREITEAFRSGFSPEILPLARLNRGNITVIKALKSIRGYLTKAAATCGKSVKSLSDAIEFLEEMQQSQWSTDEEWEKAWETHAMKLGTFDTATPARRAA